MPYSQPAVATTVAVAPSFASPYLQPAGVTAPYSQQAGPTVSYSQPAGVTAPYLQLVGPTASYSQPAVSAYTASPNPATAQLVPSVQSVVLTDIGGTATTLRQPSFTPPPLAPVAAMTPPAVALSPSVTIAVPDSPQPSAVVAASPAAAAARAGGGRIVLRSPNKTPSVTALTVKSRTVAGDSDKTAQLASPAAVPEARSPLLSAPPAEASVTAAAVTASPMAAVAADGAGKASTPQQRSKLMRARSTLLNSVFSSNLDE